MVRRIPLQRGQGAARRVIQEDCRDYVPELQLLRDFDGVVISNKGLNGTVLHDFCLLVQLFKARGLEFRRAPLSHGEFLSFVGAIF